jgi:hypothetical protein
MSNSSKYGKVGEKHQIKDFPDNKVILVTFCWLQVAIKHRSLNCSSQLYYSYDTGLERKIVIHMHLFILIDVVKIMTKIIQIIMAY